MNDKTISVPGITLCWVTSFCVDLAWHLNSLILSMTMVWLIQQAHWAATSSVRLWHLRMTTLENNVCPIVKLRSRFQVRSRSSPRSGPEGPRSKDLDLGYTLNLVCHHPPLTTHHPVNFSWDGDEYKPLLYDF